MDCLGSAQIAGVCGISERFQYFYFRRVSRRCVDKSQNTGEPPIATPPSCLADGHWWFQFLPYFASTLRRVLRTDFSAAALAVVFGADRFGANIITTRLALLWFPNPNSTVSCSVFLFNCSCLFLPLCVCSPYIYLCLIKPNLPTDTPVVT